MLHFQKKHKVVSVLLGLMLIEFVDLHLFRPKMMPTFVHWFCLVWHSLALLRPLLSATLFFGTLLLLVVVHIKSTSALIGSMDGDKFR